MNLVALLLNALTLTAILMILALGLAIIFGLMNVINLSHGEFVTIGAYTLSVVQALGGSYWLALIVAPVVGGALGLVIERLLIRFLYKRPFAAIFATWGLSLVLKQLILLSFGPAPVQVTAPIVGSVTILGESYPGYRLLLIAIAAVLISGCVIGFKHLRLGLDIRAVIQNRPIAAAMGINTERVYAIAFALGVALAAFAGVLIAPLVVVIAQMGENLLARSFFVVILGGFGNIAGVAVGSSFVGGLETLLSYNLPVTLSQALVLLLAIIIIRFRPQGLVGA
ncbi:amino acid/amide ABC transporter membrane protein 1, HAAT family [Bradyrhizobium brasilense]|uniref:Amino acid/amide ABC transporter membrane protein 1, HAAT family n=1 Tax=Bradyrhizobium brasilense TaxID=1419277 RepID=A0A1G7Q8S3_9BRAD|nr:branched-chain amino acid ABC transporter permease [Bradyrhizobium brasilense]SDF94349.1 amino acid/amide ABC transporter membrane protein 1, HAAT family [Bradyrhizobium brasilense]